MIEAAASLVERLRRQRGEVLDIAVEITRLSLDVLERTIFSEGLGDDPEEIRKGMKSYFDAIGQIDPFDLLGLPGVDAAVWTAQDRPALRLFNTAIDAIIARRRQSLAEIAPTVCRTICSLCCCGRGIRKPARSSAKKTCAPTS